MPNGLTLEYHRIAMITNEINQRTTLLVESYISEESRQIEKDYANGKFNDNPDAFRLQYTDSQYMQLEYDGEMTIEKAYEWLKTLPEYEGAEDV